ncbi:MAG: hypothetical protein ACI4LE_01730 [Faecalibacterium sp.]
MNGTGKQFEEDFAASIPPGTHCYRLRDSASSFSQDSKQTRFTWDNIADFEVYRYPNHFYFELKHTEQPSIPLDKIMGRYLPEKGQYKRQKQLDQMLAADAIRGQFARYVICYARTGHTYALPPGALLSFLQQGGRKSIPESFCQQEGLEMARRKLRVHYCYEISGLLDALGQSKVERNL